MCFFFNKPLKNLLTKVDGCMNVRLPDGRMLSNERRTVRVLWLR